MVRRSPADAKSDGSILSATAREIHWATAVISALGSTCTAMIGSGPLKTETVPAKGLILSAIAPDADIP
jgi:hypothetical protein